jgi:hypothetical protein
VLVVIALAQEKPASTSFIGGVDGMMLWLNRQHGNDDLSLQHELRLVNVDYSSACAGIWHMLLVTGALWALQHVLLPQVTTAKTSVTFRVG